MVSPFGRCPGRTAFVGRQQPPQVWTPPLMQELFDDSVEDRNESSHMFGL
jgi:hypothetical protein